MLFIQEIYILLFLYSSNISFDCTWANKPTSIVSVSSATYFYARGMSQEVILFRILIKIEIVAEVIIFNILFIVV